MSDFVFELLAQALLAAAAAVGFGLSFAVPAPVLVFCAAGGALGRGLRFALGPAGAGMPLEWATLVAAATVSLLAIWAAADLISV
ncbi:threonine/serine exporter family protein [Rubrivivax gelatinosus]|uniref:threonine/serine exporter family protein n=1 Tax=Rubrivivax gelatinosus TaxID=28068 RepID=UPI0002DD1ADB|nr:threonine/serine exporter family protein [Rubrivivax gelatinosus]